MKRSLIMMGFGLLGLGGIVGLSLRNQSQVKQEVTEGISETAPVEQSVLGTTQEQLYFTVNVPARFTQPLTAPNVLYSLTAGSGIRVSEGQSPTLTNTGVLSLQGQTGALTLTAGSGMTLSGLTLTNSDTGSGQNIFKTIAVSGQTSLSTDTNADTLTLAGSGGITLTTDPDNDKLTITSAAVDYTLSGFTDSGTSVYLTTITDNLGVGTLTPTYKLDVAGTGHYTGALTLDSTLGVTGTTTLDGALQASGNVTFGDATSDSLTFTARLANGTSLLPDTDLGSDLGSAGLRFNNLWVANINSNSSQAFSGQTTFSYAPLDTTIDEASVLINPTSSVANGQLLAFGIAGYQKALIDEDGDIILGYSDATSAPVTDTPLTIYGHSGTMVAYIDTTGNLDLDGVLSINGTTVLNATTLGAGVTNSSLTQTGALNSGSITSGFGSIDTGADAITTTGTITTGTLTIDGDTYNQITTTGSEDLAIMAGGNVGIGTTTPANTLTVLGDIASSVATGVEGLKLTDTSDVTKMALKWTSSKINLDMPSTSSVNKLSNGTFETDLTGWTEDIGYSLNDEYTTDLTAGNVNGTSAEPTGGVRTITDTNSKLSISLGNLVLTTGGSAGNPRLSYALESRSSGKVLMTSFTASGRNAFGWDSAVASGVFEGYRLLMGNGLNVYRNGTAINAGPDLIAGTNYKVAAIQRGTGTYYYVKSGSGIYTYWTLVFISDNSSADLYPVIYYDTDGNSIYNYDYTRIPTTSWLPTPLAYDTFTRADGTIGNSETTGPDSQTTPALAWTGGAISSNTNVITPSLGSELITNAGLEGTYVDGVAPNWSTVNSSTLTEETTIIHGGSSSQKVVANLNGGGIKANTNSLTNGTWYSSSAWVYNEQTGVYIWRIYDGLTYFLNYSPNIGTTGTWTQLVGTGRATNTTSSYGQPNFLSNNSGKTFYVDDTTFKPLTLSSLFSTVSTSDTDVIADANVTMTAGTQAGLVTNLDDATTPANFLIAYHDGTYVKLDKNVGGTYTNLISVAKTYSAGATLRVITYTSSGSLKVRVYYNNALVGSEQTVSDAGIISNTKHGLFSTYEGNSFDNFTLFARGSGNEYTSAPFEEVTPTQTTSYAYSGTGSVRLVAATDATYVQSVNVGDTSSYNLIAYAYTDGSAVTSADLELYYDTAVLSTTYTSVGDGWYKLSGTLTGVASAKNYGVKVKGGKTVYVDNLSIFNTSGAGTILGITNSTTGLGGMSVESTTILNSGLASLQALIVKGFSGQTEDLQEWQDSTGAVLGSLTASGGLSLTGSLDINGTSNDIAGSLNLSGNSLTSTGALTITPAAGSGMNVSLATTGDFKVNTNDLVVDTSEGRVGVGTLTPSAKLHVIALTEQERLGYDTSNYWSSTVGETGALTMQGVGSGGALTLSPTAGQDLNINLATTGDLVVNTDDLVADTSSGYIGINTTAPTALLDLAGTSGIDAFRLTNSGTKVLGLSYGTNNTTFNTNSTDPTNKLTNGTFDTDLTSWSEEPSYTLNDEFTTDRAAGAVNGTSAEPTGGTRTVADTLSKLTIGNGTLNFAATGGGGMNPGLWYTGQSRVAGKIMSCEYVGTASRFYCGWDTSASASHMTTAHSIRANPSSDFVIYPGATNVSSALTPGTSYRLVLVLRETGAYYYIKGGTYTNWTLLWIGATDSTATLYPGVGTSDTTTVASIDNMRIPTEIWLPTPLAYDTFTRADGTIGSSETTGPDSQTTPALAWTGGAISSNTNVITPTAGSTVLTNGDFTNWTGDNPDNWTLSFTEDANNYITEAGPTGQARIVCDNNVGTGMNQNPVLTIGTWYQVSANVTDYVSGALNFYLGSGNLWGSSLFSSVGVSTYSGIAKSSTIFQINRTSSEDITLDDLTVKPLTLSTLFSTVSTSDEDVVISTDVTAEIINPAGIVTNLDNASSPTAGIVVYVKRHPTAASSTVYIDKFTTETTWTNLTSGTVTYVEGAQLRVITWHSDANTLKVRVYYNGTIVGTEQTITDASIISNTKHGLFSTYLGNSFDNFSLFARGTGGEYGSAPLEEVVATAESNITYNNSDGSVKLVAPTDGTYLQSVNVGDTETYNLIAYAYTDGSAVTSADLSLYYDTTTLSTTYTPMGGTGWYKLTGSFTGEASAKNYGVRVKAGKTVYIDEVKLQVGVGSTQTMYVLDSNTGVTGLNVQGLINGTLNGVATYAKAGTISDTDFSGGATDGLLGIDTTNHRIYFREGGEWHYAARTAGFQIPKEEVAGLSIGDTLIPYVETFMSDGAVHGLYRKLDINQLLSTSSAITLTNDVTFNNRVTFADSDMAGVARIGAGSEQVEVIFGKPFANPPIVTYSLITLSASESATMAEGRRSTLTNVTESGFRIVLPSPASREFWYNWVAIPIASDPVDLSVPALYTEGP